jgi:cytosine/adenosine deaminase-related metal-dependent hydrolase
VRQRRLAARWVLPISGAPIEFGALLIDADGRIQSVGPDREVPRPTEVPSLAFEDAALLPGLINTHTHLELTGFERLIPAADFPAWIRRLRELKATRALDQYLNAARQGLADCYAAGVTTVADTGDSGSVIRVLAEAEGSGIAYQEVFGPHPRQLEESLRDLKRAVRDLSKLANGRVRLGVSPHAPYTVSGPLLRAVAAWSRTEHLPLAVHVAESKAESELLLTGSGPFAEAWRTRGIPPPSSCGKSPIDWLADHGVLSPLCLCIHAVQVGINDIRRIAEAGAAVAHCPLSNQAHGHGLAPLQQLLQAGIHVGLGTDSVASVGRLDLLAEARLAGRHASLGAEALLELCTLAGARALNLSAELGSLEPGKWGDCTVIRLPRQDGTPSERVLASGPGDVLRTYVGGREVYRAA